MTKCPNCLYRKDCVESPDVLEMVMDFLTGLLPTLPARKIIFTSRDMLSIY